MVKGGACQPSAAPRTPARAPRATRAYIWRAFPPETSGPATRPRPGLAPRRPGGWERLFLCERQRFAPSNRPGLLARPTRVQNYLGALAPLRGSRTAGGPVPWRDAGLRGRRDRRWPGSMARGDVCRHVEVSTNARRLCRVLLAFPFEHPIWRRRRHRRVRHEHVACMQSEALSGQIMIRTRCQSEESRAYSSCSDGIVHTRATPQMSGQRPPQTDGLVPRRV
jgi:hypothetical protein